MLLETLFRNLNTYQDKMAFVIEDISFSYLDVKEKVAQIQGELKKIAIKENDIVLVYTHNDLATYAAFIAVWLSGGTVVPINPSHPTKRQTAIINQMNITCAISSVLSDSNSSITFIDTATLSSNKREISLTQTAPNRIFYILFTSGSTGNPKGVPISLQSCSAYITENRKLFTNADENSRFLQMFDLTFDASIQSYLLPLYLGAAIVTVSPNSIKYLEVVKLITKYNITFAKISNSIITYIKPYFKSIYLPKLKYCVFGGGEGLALDLVSAWKKCIPNAQIQNVYGPTEATVNTHFYLLPENLSNIKHHNGIIAIGKTFGKNAFLIIDENGQEINDSSIGELCLSGPQLTEGYWSDPKKNSTVFFKMLQQNTKRRFYKTGDLVYQDADGDVLFVGRKDSQVKIQGFRVELSEIEYSVKRIENTINCTALSYKNKQGITELALFTEMSQLPPLALRTKLKEQLPKYMIPSQIINLASFPKTPNGKIDKMSLLNKIPIH